jgi:predicted HicB family RNase H-like nuclease
VAEEEYVPDPNYQPKEDDYMSDSYLEALQSVEESRKASEAETERRKELRRRRRFALRLPSSLYDQVAVTARSEGVSMNTYIAAVLAAAVKWRAKERPEEAAASKETPEQRAQRELDEMWRIFR